MPDGISDEVLSGQTLESACEHAYTRKAEQRYSVRYLKMKKRIGDEGMPRKRNTAVHYLLKKARLRTILYNCFR